MREAVQFSEIEVSSLGASQLRPDFHTQPESNYGRGCAARGVFNDIVVD